MHLRSLSLWLGIFQPPPSTPPSTNGSTAAPTSDATTAPTGTPDDGAARGRTHTGSNGYQEVLPDGAVDEAVPLPLSDDDDNDDERGAHEPDQVLWTIDNPDVDHMKDLEIIKR